MEHLLRLHCALNESVEALRDAELLLTAAQQSPADFDPAFVEAKVEHAVDATIVVLQMRSILPRPS